MSKKIVGSVEVEASCATSLAECGFVDENILLDVKKHGIWQGVRLAANMLIKTF